MLVSTTAGAGVRDPSALLKGTSENRLESMFEES
jgi:hypothetical protein